MWHDTVKFVSQTGCFVFYFSTNSWTDNVFCAVFYSFYLGRGFFFQQTNYLRTTQILPKSIGDWNNFGMLKQTLYDVFVWCQPDTANIELLCINQVDAFVYVWCFVHVLCNCFPLYFRRQQYFVWFIGQYNQILWYGCWLWTFYGILIGYVTSSNESR